MRAQAWSCLARLAAAAGVTGGTSAAAAVCSSGAQLQVQQLVRGIFCISGVSSSSCSSWHIQLQQQQPWHELHRLAGKSICCMPLPAPLTHIMRVCRMAA